MPIYRSREESTLAAISAAANPINTSGKFRNKEAVDATNDRLYRATGPAAIDPWRPADDQSGFADVTPA